MSALTVLDFPKRKAAHSPLSMLTCYDYTYARMLNQSAVDLLLVGDSVAMIVHGFQSTIHADVNMMALHTAAVRRGAPNKFIVADMPFLSVRRGLEFAMDAVTRLMQAGANAIKIEGANGQLDLMRHIAESGVPVMGHLGLTPQSVEALGGHKVQGRTEGAAATLLNTAHDVAATGAFALVLECVPAILATRVTKELSIPVIGIGAGSGTDGQVLVLQDMLGCNSAFRPKFLRHYADHEQTVVNAAGRFHQDVSSRAYPNIAESYA
ncbi:MAG: 3-methyl-2-oxobutanoate hydroxymethyltransferase [Gammaproteobacteria bacterium]|nr:3-methyl-2-oxobutanoate hydroxymethyltransferase [Gammaproteobacteria bacterium]